MMNASRVVQILAVLVPIAGGCNAILGIESHALAPGGSGGGGGTGGAAGGSSCDVDAAVMDAGPGTTCGFVMPNPASAGLPNPATYTANLASGSVTDNVTGLIWEANSGFTVYMQGQASRPCDERGPGWRLPTRIELASLVDFTVSKPGPTINNAFANDPIWAASPNTNDKTDRRFWTSSHAACSTSIGWFVDFADGSTHQEIKPDLAYKVRCVYAAPSSCSSWRYQLPGDGTVHDGATGLTWQQAVAAARPWSEANAYCPATFGGDWRLPSLTEMQTIIDETVQNPSIDVTAFPGTPPMGYFWTSSLQAGIPDWAWYVTVVHGHAAPEPVTTAYYVRCVRWDGR
jgi:hypothetical protein